MEKLTSSNLKGNWATLLLATDSEGRLDMARLSDEMDALIASSPDGIYSKMYRCRCSLPDRCQPSVRTDITGKAQARDTIETRSHTGHPAGLVSRKR